VNARRYSVSQSFTTDEGVDIEMAGYRYFYVIGTTMYTVSYEFFQSQRDFYEPIFNAIMDSYRITRAETDFDNHITSAQMAALRIAGHPELRDSILNNNRDDILRLAYELQEIEGLEFLTITDGEGIVIVRTHAPAGHYGDFIGHLSHVNTALSGNAESYVMQHDIWGLSVYAGAPIYNDGGIVGVVSAGFRLDATYAE
jgi:sensor histidine kinase regulating citrate/malate metabolism